MMADLVGEDAHERPVTPSLLLHLLHENRVVGDDARALAVDERRRVGHVPRGANLDRGRGETLAANDPLEYGNSFTISLERSEAQLANRHVEAMSILAELVYLDVE